jgi:hypothetical protein
VSNSSQSTIEYFTGHDSQNSDHNADHSDQDSTHSDHDTHHSDDELFQSNDESHQSNVTRDDDGSDEDSGTEIQSVPSNQNDSSTVEEQSSTDGNNDDSSIVTIDLSATQRHFPVPRPLPTPHIEDDDDLICLGTQPIPFIDLCDSEVDLTAGTPEAAPSGAQAMPAPTVRPRRRAMPQPIPTDSQVEILAAPGVALPQPMEIDESPPPVPPVPAPAPRSSNPIPTPSFSTSTPRVGVSVFQIPGFGGDLARILNAVHGFISDDSPPQARGRGRAARRGGANNRRRNTPYASGNTPQPPQPVMDEWERIHGRSPPRTGAAMTQQDPNAAAGTDSSFQCPICLESMKGNHPMSTTCGHVSFSITVFLNHPISKNPIKIPGFLSQLHQTSFPKRQKVPNVQESPENRPNSSTVHIIVQQPRKITENFQISQIICRSEKHN